MMFVLLASIFVLIFIFGLVGAIYPTKLHKQMKLGNRLRNVALFFVSFIAFFVVVINSPDESQPVAQETKLHQEEQNKAVNWQEEIKKIATSDKTETEKCDEVSSLARNYRPELKEIAEFETYIVEEFKTGRYLSDLKNHEYMLTNIFKSEVVHRYYDDQLNTPIDKFAFYFWQNSKYTYRGADSVYSADTVRNKERMEELLKKMQ
jgi:hypothetical protein